MSTGDAFSAGLIHDLGVALLHRHEPGRYDTFIASRHLPEQQALELEVELFGVDHAAAAAATLAEIRFPKLLVDAVADHHAPRRRRRLGKPDLAAVVATGEVLGAAIEPDGRLADLDELARCLEAVGVVAQPEHLVAELRATLESITGFVAV
jgi:HD-like signal output (HDOD) protein